MFAARFKLKMGKEEGNEYWKKTLFFLQFRFDHNYAHSRLHWTGKNSH
jgi:hypothetical protein